MRQLPSVSAEEFCSKRRPCWGRGDVLALCAKYRRSKWTALEVLSLDELPAADRLWVVLHDSLLPSVVMRRFAVEVAAEAMRKADHFDQRSWTALDAAMAYERGEIDDATRAAAFDVASDAARAATRAAAGAAAWAATRAAAFDVAITSVKNRITGIDISVTGTPQYNATGDAASDAAWDAQIVMLRQITLRWLGGEDIAAGGPWKRPHGEERARQSMLDNWHSRAPV